MDEAIGCGYGGNPVGEDPVPFSAAADQSLGQAQAALRLAQRDEAAVRSIQAALESDAHLSCGV